MMKRLSNFLHRDHPLRDNAEPVADAAAANQPVANRAATPRERGRNRNVVLQAAADPRAARAAPQEPFSPELLAAAMAHLEAGQRRSPQRAAAACRQVEAAANEPANAPAARPARQGYPSEPFDLRLSDLRMHRTETDHNLVFAHPIPAGPFEPVALAVDAASAGLEGRAYIEYLRDNPRTRPEMKLLIKSKILRTEFPLSEDRLNEIASRLRVVMAEAYLNPHLMGEVNVIAVEAMPHCHDRTDVAIAQMEDAALHARLIRGAVTDETTLYNYGTSFFMLDAVREETEQLLRARRAEGVDTRQEVHDILNARYYLQDTLHLPHRMQRPIVPRAMFGIVTRRVAEEVILPRVTARAIENNGQNVMRFISNWAPWRRHLDAHWPAMQGMSASFHELLEEIMENRNIPGSHIAQLSEVDFNAKIRQTQADKVRAEAELADQLALELLFNRRGEYLVTHNHLSDYFR